MRVLRPAIASLLILAFVFAVQANQRTRITMVLVNGHDTGWPEQDLAGKLERLLSTKGEFELVPLIEKDQLSQEVNGRFQKEQLIDWGLRIDCRYIIWFEVLREDLSLERNFSIPFVLNQKRITARLELDYRIVDCFRGRLIHVDQISKRRYGPSSMQLVEDSGADPALHLNYPERRELFDRLEEDAIDEVFAELERIAKQR